jgi:alpha-beta hydrolase superfamily lysophospholipase
MAASYSVERIEHFIPSSDGASQLRVSLWIPYLPESQLKGIVQIVHGMEEHIDRYDGFARFLACQGFIVGAHDHVGHGKSVADARDLGHVTLDHGSDVLINDVDRVRKTLFESFSGLPYFIFGHSMGSFVTRVYLSRHAQGVKGAIICGTGNQPYALARSGNMLAHAIGALRGGRFKSRLLDKMGAGGFGKTIEDARTPLDWISIDPAVVDAYIDDPLCGVMFTVGGYAALTGVVSQAVSPKVAARIPKNLPMLFIAGAEDPVGEKGEAVVRAVELYHDAGMKDVSLILYPGMRHEILNEPGKQKVMDDVLKWIEKHVGEE